MERMKPTAYKIGEGERKGLSKDMQEIILAYEEEIKTLKEENAELKEHKENLIWLDKKKDKEIEKLEEEKLELKSELSKFRDSFKKYRDYEKEELAESCYDLARENEKLKEENKKLKSNYYNLSKIVEVNGGYKASYVNELRDEIAKLEIYKKQYEHTMGGDYIDEDLYDLDC